MSYIFLNITANNRLLENTLISIWLVSFGQWIPSKETATKVMAGADAKDDVTIEGNRH